MFFTYCMQCLNISGPYSTPWHITCTLYKYELCAYSILMNLNVLVLYFHAYVNLFFVLSPKSVSPSRLAPLTSTPAQTPGQVVPSAQGEDGDRWMSGKVGFICGKKKNNIRLDNKLDKHKLSRRAIKLCNKKEATQVNIKPYTSEQEGKQHKGGQLEKTRQTWQNSNET